MNRQMNKVIKDIYRKMLTEGAEVESIRIYNNICSMVLSTQSFWPYDPSDGTTEYHYVLTPIV